MASRKYDEEAKKLGVAIDCALVALQKHPPTNLSPEQLAHFCRFYAEAKQNALQAAPPYQNLASLHYVVQDVFTYFQEASGVCVECFWKQIDELRLGYRRVDLLQKILKKGKINTQAEHDYVTDVLVAAQQEGRLNAQEIQQLNDCLGRFELKQSRSAARSGS